MRKSDRYSQRAAARLELLPDPRYADPGYDDLEDSQPDTEVPTSASPHFYRPQRVPNPRPSEDFDSPARTQEDPNAYPDQFLRAPRRVAVRRGALPESLSGRIVFFGTTALALLALAALVYAIAHYLLNDDHFRLATPSAIQLTGDQHVPHAVLMEVFSHDVGRNVFTIPLSDRRAALESNPWVAHATVMRLLPNRLRVTIVERRPVAFTRNGNSIALVDATGALMDLPRAGLAAWSLPVVIGVTPDLPLSTRAARMEIFNNFTAQIDSAGPALSRKLSEVDLTDPDDVKALVSESGPDGASDVLVHFGSADYLTRFQSFEQHLAEWRQLYPHLASADMRYDHQVVLDMEPGTVTPAVNAPASSSEPTAASDKTQPEPTTAQPAPAASASAPAFHTTQTAPPAKSETAKPKHSGFTLPSWMKFNPSKPDIPPPAAKSAPAAKSTPAKSSPAKPSPAQPAYTAPPVVQQQTNTQLQPAGKSTRTQKPSAAHFALSVEPTPAAPAPSSPAPQNKTAPATQQKSAQQKAAQQKKPQTKSPAAPKAKSPASAKARPTAKPSPKSAKSTTKTAAHVPTKKPTARPTHSDDAPMVLPSINSTTTSHKFVPATVGGLQ